MATIVKPLLSSIVAEQLPDFIQSDYGKFVAFLEAYYEFVEQTNIRNIEQSRDLDYALDLFVDKLKEEIDYLGNTYSYVDKRFLLEHIKDIHLAKGSELSYKLLIKLLFNKDVEIKYPGNYLLKPSDGKWNLDVSVLITATTGDVTTIEGKEVTFIVGTKRIKYLVAKVIATEFTGVYECKIESQVYTDLPAGTMLQYNSFIGSVAPTTVSATIGSAGKGFKAGQVFDIVSTTGSGTKIKITETTAEGAVKRLKIIKFGYGYTTRFNVSISPTSSSTQASVFDPFADTMNSFTDSGYILDNDYFADDYTDYNYAGELLSTFTNLTNAQTSANTANNLIIGFEIGGKAVYPGYYSDNSGFLSDTIYLQDSKYYQKFSYVLSLEEQLDSYKNFLTKYLHPAGMIMFGEYNVTAEISAESHASLVYNIN